MSLALAGAREMRDKFDNAGFVAGLAIHRFDNIEPVPFALARPGLERARLHPLARLGGNRLDEIIDLAHGKGRIAGPHPRFRAVRLCLALHHRLAAFGIGDRGGSRLAAGAGLDCHAAR